MTDAAWRRATEAVEPDAFGKLVAEEVLRAAAPLVPDGCEGDELAIMLGLAANTAVRRLIDAVYLELLTGGEGDDPETFAALEATVDACRTAREALLHPDGQQTAVDLLESVLVAWERNMGGEANGTRA